MKIKIPFKIAKYSNNEQFIILIDQFILVVFLVQKVQWFKKSEAKIAF